MHQYVKSGILENIDSVRRIPVGRLWGVQLYVTPWTWLSPFIFFALVLTIGLLSPMPLAERLYRALVSTIAIELANLLHALGHIIGGKLVHGVMDALLFTATRDVNLYYGEQGHLPSRVHLGRALGGPVGNIIVGLLVQGVLGGRLDGFVADLIASFVWTNLFFGLGSLLPIPSVDGEVIWREGLKLVRGRAQSAPPR